MVATIQTNKCIHILSDRGSQYASIGFRRLRERLNIGLSMSHKGKSWDNTVAEPFFSTLKTESKFNLAVPREIDRARSIVCPFIELYYNRQRIIPKLSYKSPIDFEAQMLSTKLECLH